MSARIGRAIIVWWHDTDRWLVRGIFFTGFWAYVCFSIRPRLIYDAFGIYLPYPEFSVDRACFREAFSRAAGPLEYASAFLSQWFFVSPVGALIVTGAAGLICFGTERLIREREETRWWLPCLLPALAVLIVYQTYHHPLTALLALAICLWLAVGYKTLARRIRVHGVLAAWQPIAFLVMCVSLYYLAGTVCLLFGLLVGTWHVCVERRVVAGAGAIMASALVPWLVGTKWFYMTPVEAYCVAWPFGPGSASDLETGPLNVLRGLFPFPLGMLLVAALCRGLPRRLQDRVAGLSRRGGRALRVTAQLLLLAAAVAAVHQFLRAPHREKRFEMVHFTLQRQWDQVLLVARQLPPSRHDCFSRHLVNRALYHTGRLGEKMFSFSQDQAGLLLLSDDARHGAPKFWMLSEIAWELGDLNFAEQRAFERIEAVGECPSALELLAKSFLAKSRTQARSTAPKTGASAFETVRTTSPGRGTDDTSASSREAARVLLNRMAKNVIHGRRAEELLGLLDASDAADVPWLQDVDRVGALRCKDDRVFQDYSEELMLAGLLRANPRNQMAFEYLMAFYLLSRRTDKVVENLHRLNDFGYRGIPRHYEEAILIHANETSQPVPLHGRQIRPATVQACQRFLDRVRPWQDQPQLIMGELADEFGDSYFYYYAFGISGTGGSR
ncbi:MAG TPA: DUF6057 family protein [Candidatus Anammoximicrobium sp.]|nr:DUF6057 family protein [Candidatus Anammoximicrobium sp.]